jgi:hypothetical protein
MKHFLPKTLHTTSIVPRSNRTNKQHQQPSTNTRIARHAYAAEFDSTLRLRYSRQNVVILYQANEALFLTCNSNRQFYCMLYPNDRCRILSIMKKWCHHYAGTVSIVPMIMVCVALPVAPGGGVGVGGGCSRRWCRD